ncbi:type i modular polyketide synthase [Lasius niger]|uniref:Type i modular polyketide synthase n=1 Tax=Lasius niger TaxID=67767 RepID=A0A0J7KH72_LASNI|nr:type i modular polyketide synthase [Lasius niger]
MTVDDEIDIFQEFLLPEEYNYRNVTRMSVTGCVSANLHYSSLPEAIGLEEMIVQNISGRLNFNVFITSNRMKLLRLSNIGRIPMIASHTFTNLAAIETFEITNALIENFEEDFSYINVSRFLVTNVTIERLDRLNVSEKGMTLSIVNSELRNVATSLNFANFLYIEIIGSKFELQKPGLVSIQGDVTIVKNSVFTNVSMNLVAKNAVTINGICAVGKSTLRLASKYINSTDNRLPNEIAYPRDNNQKPEFFTNRNNTVCKAGNCKCPKSNGQTPCQPIVPTFILGCSLVSLLSRGFQ